MTLLLWPPPQSNNGTFVNGRRLSGKKQWSEPEKLLDGDLVRIGTTELVASIPLPPGPAAAAPPPAAPAAAREETAAASGLSGLSGAKGLHPRS